MTNTIKATPEDYKHYSDEQIAELAAMLLDARNIPYVIG